MRDDKASRLSPEAIAAKHGVTVPTVYNHLRLLRLHAELQAAVDAGELPMREAVKLSRLPQGEQLATFRRMVAADATHGARAARSIAAASSGKHDDIGISTRRMRAGDFLERWYCVLLSRPERVLDARQVLAFVMGEPPPNDATFLETLEEAGWKPRRYDRVK